MNQASQELAFQRQFLHPRYWLTWLGVGLLGLLAWAPSKLRHKLGHALGTLLYRHNKKRRHISLTNLKLCFPELPKSQRQHMAHQHLQAYACAMLDYSILFFRSRTWLHQRCQLIESASFQQARQQQSNVILFLGHSVWLEFAPLAIGQHYHSYGSYKPFANAVLNWLIARSRLRDVDFVIPRDEGMLRLVKACSAEKMMIFLPDEDHGEQFSVYAPFMGQTKATLNTPPRLAKLTKAKCFPVLTLYNQSSGIYQTYIGDQLEHYPNQDPIQNAITLNHALEQLIHLAPNQYMWILKLFKTQPNNIKHY